ncbi:MAG: LPS export ABC transporter permease LptF [Betaproteobacteria bacterium TMED156]|nr:MAG: LPS export ABC transporter permease LptF [Betaproteobacteria bacterium TMED156]
MTFACLLTVVITMALVRTLGNAASGQLEAQLVIPLIGFSTISSISTILTLTAFLSVFVVLSRQCRDNEMVIWLSSGQNLTSYIPVVWKFSLSFILLTILTSILATPWARSQADELRQQSLAEKKLTEIPPGTFSEFTNGEKVIFIEQTDKESSNLGLVFISIKQKNNQEIIVMGTKGKLIYDQKQLPWIQLKLGSRTDIMSLDSSAEVRSTKFENYKMRIDSPPKSTSYRERVRSTSTWVLFERSAPADLGELSFRIGTILLCIFLPFLSIPLSSLENKQGRLIHIFGALLIFIAFNNMLGIIQALVAKKEITFIFGLIILPVSILLITTFLIYIKMYILRNPFALILKKFHSI